MTVAANKRPFQDTLVMTAAELRSTYLFGVDLSDNDGNQMPDATLEFYILAAQNWLEQEVGGLLLTKQTIETEKHDYRLGDYIQYNFIKLFRYPVQSVEKVAIQFPLSQDVLEFDDSWYRTESVSGQVQLFPTQGTFSSIILSQGGSYIPLVYSGVAYVPHVMIVDYTAGFEAGEFPAAIKNVIGMKASQGPLNIAGDLIAGAGIAAKSISLDGLSQSISTTSSATNAGYGARILQYEKQIQGELKNLRNYYTGLQMVVA